MTIDTLERAARCSGSCRYSRSDVTAVAIVRRDASLVIIIIGGTAMLSNYNDNTVTSSKAVEGCSEYTAGVWSVQDVGGYWRTGSLDFCEVGRLVENGSDMALD